jgi:hypothetical protein
MGPPEIFNQEDLARGILRVPNGTPKPTILDMRAIAEAEGRIREIAGVNAHKAPELLSMFNRVYLDINDYIRQAKLDQQQATKKMEQRRSVVILDLVPDILTKKGLVRPGSPGGSEDLRNAVLAQDQEFQQAKDEAELAEACYELLKGKQRAIEMAYSSVKKIIGDGKDWRDLAALRTSAGAEPKGEPGSRPKSPGRSHPGFGSGD